MSINDPISKYSIDELVEKCQTLDALSEIQKEFLKREDIKKVLDVKKSKIPNVPLINFIKVIVKVVNAKIALENTIKVKGTILMVRDRITKRYLAELDTKHLRKKQIFVITDDNKVLVLEHFGNILNNTTMDVAPAMYGEVAYTTEHWTMGDYKGTTLEMRDFVLEKTLTVQELQDFIEERKLVDNALEFDAEDDLYRMVIIKGNISRLLKLKKLYINPETGKMAARDELHNYLEESYNPNNKELTPILRLDVKMGTGRHELVAVEFRKTKFGKNTIMLPEFVNLLEKSEDSQDNESRQMWYDLFGNLTCYFIGTLRKFNPNLILDDNRIALKVTIDLGTILPAKDELIIAKIETTQTKLPTTPVPQKGGTDTIAFITKQYDILSGIITDPTALRNALEAAIKKEYGEDKVKDVEVVKKLDDLC